MSQLYIRLRTGFYSHVKTLRLKSRLGMDALWLVPRIWAFAAESQPDGDLSGYTAGEIAALVGYMGDASGMLVALKDCGFMDAEGRIHDWSEHNGFHFKFSARGKTAAAARWGKGDRERDKDKDKDKERETSNAIGMQQASKSVLAYLNTKAGRNFRETPDNLKAIRLRLEEVAGDAEGVKAMLDRQIALWKGDAVMDEYLRVTTLFNKRKFHGYYDARTQLIISGDNRKPNTRNAGIVRGPTDYGAAGRRKQERQSPGSLAGQVALPGIEPPGAGDAGGGIL